MNDRLPTALQIIEEVATMPTEDEKASLELIARVREHLVNPFDELPQQEPLIKIDDTTLCSKGDLVVVKAQPKCGKSTLLSIFSGVLLGACHFGRLNCNLQGLTIATIDTEMDSRDTQRMTNLSLAISGCSDTDRLLAFNFRKEEPQEIIKMIECILKTFHPDVLMIDGMLDLVRDFNSVEESQQLVKNHLLAWADTFGCCIFAVIHTNKTNDLTTSQGHLGGALDKKSEVVLLCQKDAENGNVTVSAPLCRHKTIPTFSFGYKADGTPYDSNAEMMTQKALRQQEKEHLKAERQHQKLMDLWVEAKSFFTPQESSIERGVFLRSITQKGLRSKNHAAKLADNFVNEGFITYNEIHNSYTITDLGLQK